MKRLLILCNKFPFPPRDGSSIAMASQIRGLLNAGVELDVVSLNTAKHFVPEPENIAPKQVNWHIHNVNTTPSGSEAIINLLFSKESYMVSRFNIPEVHNTIQKLVSETAFDAAIIDGLFMMPYASEIRQVDIPIVLRAHNVENQIWNRQIQREPNPLKRRYLKIQNQRLLRFELEACKQSNLVVPITEEDAKWYASKGCPIHVMPCGIHADDYPNLGSAEGDVFHIGAMDWTPNVDGIEWFFKKVWPAVFKKSTSSVFHLAGRDSDQLNLHHPELGFFVEGRVESAKEFYSKHGIFVVPLLAGSGMRIKVMEAMTYGKAIVATSIGVEGIPVEDKIHVRIADSPQEFASAILELMNNRDERFELGQRARNLALRIFDESVLATDLLKSLSTQL